MLLVWRRLFERIGEKVYEIRLENGKEREGRKLRNMGEKEEGKKRG